MDFFHPRPLSAMPAGARLVWAAYQELDRTQWLGSDELENLQLRQVRSLVEHCYEQVPYYRRVFSEAGVRPSAIESLADFRRIPLLTRELYQANFADLQARKLPAGMTPLGDGSFTSGVNGVPIKVLKTNRDELLWRAFYLRDLEWCGIDPRGSLASIRLAATSKRELPKALEGVSLPNWRKLHPLLETGRLHGMDIRQEPRQQLAWLRRVDPDYLLSLPSNLDFLASLVQESGQRLASLRVIQAIGETLSETTRQRIEAGFGVPVKNLYSATEAGYIASACPLGHGLHVHCENVLAEVLDPEGRPCEPGQTGRLVFTSLLNFLTPFVRYDILDDVTLSPTACPCGRGLPLWTQVEGRRHPLLFLPGGRRKAITGLYMELRKVGGCRQLQIIQRAEDHVILRVVPDQTWGPDYACRMQQVVHDEFECPIRVDVEEREFLERPAGGKLKFAVVEMEESAERS
jgi:phenylacetate-CoA ligase